MPSRTRILTKDATWWSNTSLVTTFYVTVSELKVFKKLMLDNLVHECIMKHMVLAM